MTMQELLDKYPEIADVPYTKLLQYDKTILGRRVVKKLNVNPNLPEDLKRDLKLVFEIR